jgi:hypothetical protein
MHAICAERIEYQRADLKVFAQSRCVIPVQSARLEGVDVLEDRGMVIWLAGMWTQYEQPSARVESCAVITHLNRVDDSRGLIDLRGCKTVRLTSPTRADRIPFPSGNLNHAFPPAMPATQ